MPPLLRLCPPYCTCELIPCHRCGCRCCCRDHEPLLLLLLCAPPAPYGTVGKSLERAGMEAAAIDHLVLHQANQRIIDGAAKKLGLGPDKVISNIAKYGNTSAGSVPIALAEAVAEGRIKKGDVVATAGFGAGLTWASAILRW